MPTDDNPIFERRRDNALVSSDPARLDMEVIYGFLSRVYWSKGIPRDVLERAVRNSLCFGVYVDGTQVGFARCITDRATFAYLADVFILESHRARGLSKLLMEAIMAHPDLQGLRRFSLATRDAHGLYRQFGFQAPTMPERLMEIVDLEVYKRKSADAPNISAARPNQVAQAPQSREQGLIGRAQTPARRGAVAEVLFVCIGNACRSPMAEAFANYLGAGLVRAWSAGLFPVGWIAPETYAVMQEKELSLEGQSSKGLESVPVERMDLVIDMAGLDFTVPTPAGFKGRVIRWNIPDAFTSDLDCNRATREVVEAHVRALLDEIRQNADAANNAYEAARRLPAPAMGEAGAEAVSAAQRTRSQRGGNILFVCIGNSCRSQMAEAFANRFGQGKVRAWSAGSAPLGWIARETFTVMQEKGISLDGQTSKSLREVKVAEMDFVVRMGCGVVCPVPAGFRGRLIEWNIPDPLTGGLDRYRAARDLIETHVKDLLSEVAGGRSLSNP